MLAGNVDFIARYADHSEHRSSIHNGAAARLEHGWDFVLHAQPHALRVDVHDAIENLLVLLEERKRHLLDPGVVEGEVEPAELLQRPFDEFLDLDRLRDVGRHEEVAGSCAIVFFAPRRVCLCSNSLMQYQRPSLNSLNYFEKLE